MTAGKRATVKVRWERGGVIGPWMTPEQAADLAELLEQQVLDCGDGYGFVPFTGFDGRDVLIRGREVITIEAIPEAPARLVPPTILDRPAETFTGEVHTGTPVSYPATGIRSTTGGGTQFLRQQAAHQQATGARR